MKNFSLSVLICVFSFLATTESVFARGVEIETHPVLVTAKKINRTLLIFEPLPESLGFNFQ